MTAEQGLQHGSNWKLTLAYDGTDYYGWQVQPDRATIQGTLAEAIEQVTGERVLPQGSGRTDAGVHARGQVASFVLGAPIPAENFQRALNRRLPEAIRVLMTEPAAAEFHARHSARAKTYEYRIYRGEICPPWMARFAWAMNSTPARRRAGDPGNWPLDVGRMQEAAKLVIGTHDFTSFAASDPDLHSVQRKACLPGTPDLTERRGAEDGGDEAREGNIRTIFESGWTEDGDVLTYRVRGNGFLHHMVRNLVGTFVDAGRGRTETEEIGRILQVRSRDAAGATAPARGLFLDSVEY
jgi:tRNA pseudouridine38-40 synthase